MSRVFIPRKLLDFESVQARSLSEACNKKLRTDYEDLCIKKRDLYKFVHEFLNFFILFWRYTFILKILV
ncbi:hypothetical protein BK732_07610 [Bacillus thuringiensis serovar navarrensis]|uniref:Uncharacterized protein n=1 Tax=Bacillus thuringiensis serovar navarrensis TaxID=339658 RepID=A0A243AK32_BACTU|nr:hypothetical protein BK732_07610 [Bacillus thuringiensis serovar navarrensis]